MNDMHGTANQNVIEGNKKHEHREPYVVKGHPEAAFWRGTVLFCSKQ